MLYDPVQGFFSGLNSGVGRMAVGFLAVAAAAAVCFLPMMYDPASHKLCWESEWPYLWIYALPFMLVAWSTYGFWFLVGFLSMVTLIVSYFAFVQDLYFQSKQSFYAAFAAATVYYFPATFGESRWIATVILFVVATVIYWFPSGIVALLQAIAAKLKVPKP